MDKFRPIWEDTGHNLVTKSLECESESQTPDHAAPIYKKSHPLSITFTVFKYPSKTLGQFIKRLRLDKRLEQRELAKKIAVHESSIYNWENERKRLSEKKKVSPVFLR